MQGDDIRLLQERRQILNALDASLLKFGIRNVGIVTDHLHSPGTQELGNAATDTAETDDAERNSWIAVFFAMTDKRSLEFHISPAGRRFQIAVALASLLEQREHV